MAIGEAPEFARELADRLQESGWTAEAKGPERGWSHAQVTAVHEVGARVHVLADREYNRKGRSRFVHRRYLIGVPHKPKLRWYSVSLEALLDFALHPGVSVPGDAVRVAPPEGAGCQCDKEKFTETQAKDAVLKAKIKYAGGNDRRLERRAYDCDDDPSVWHLTKKTERRGPFSSR